MNKGLTKLVCAALTATTVISCVPATVSINTELPLAVSAAAADTVNVYACEGVMEAAYIEWAAVSGASHYYVSYAKDGASFKDIDDSLIRKYPDRWRADLIGLAAGNYDIKVTAKDANGGVMAEQTAKCTVAAQDRTGFTFSPKSIAYDNGGCGAYNADGTLKSGATVLYITEDNFDTVKLDLKDKKGDAYTAIGLADICKTMGDAAANGSTNPPLAVRFLGTINDSHTGLASPSILETKGKQDNPVNITFEGVGQDTIFNGLALRLNGVANCEIRNIAFYNWHDDAIQLQGNENSNHWIHNNDLFYGENHGGDQKKGDGATDLKDDSKYITYSYNRYWDSGKTSLCGMKSETGDNYITYHHNWFDHSDSRHPRIRTMFVHVYNNYYDGNAKYGVGAANSSSAFVEGNYFRNCKHPMLSSKQGSDIMANEKTGVADFSAKGTFSKEPGGIIKAYNNHIEGSDKNEAKTGEVEPVYYDATATETNGAATQFDAYLAKSRDEQVPSSVKALLGGKTFNNANVDSYVLSIPVQEPEAAKDKVTTYAGRTGNHFTFTFTDADDKDYEINTALESKLKTYATDKSDDYVSIGGASDGSGPVPVQSTTTESTTEITTVETSSEATTNEIPTETTTTSLVALDASTYAADTIIADTARFDVVGNSGKNGQIKINETGTIKFAVKEGANVVVNYKCGSSDAAKSAGIACAGKNGATLSGGSEPAILELNSLNAGEYTITASQQGGTTAQIVSIVVTYANEEVGIWGDADNSGLLTANDAAVIVLYTLNPTAANLDATTVKYCDVDANSTISSNDAALVLQKTLSADFVFPAEN